MNNLKRLHLKITGVVQGVGFRPFIYRLATELNLKGWVNNTSQGVFIEIEGTENQLTVFQEKLLTEKPNLSQIFTIEKIELRPINDNEFKIIHSINGEKTTLILPEIATCKDCLEEIFNPLNRRFRYPFTNCTNCGPRYTIIESLPYDRENTTMRGFILCPQCQSEYNNPLNRRFHAQPNACSVCGPHLELWDRQGNVLSTHDQALLDTAAAIKEGKILAIKGLGGYHLVVDARNREAVKLLRERKKRPDKPLALMYPNLDLIKNNCDVSELEEKLLTSVEAPIVLLKKKNNLNLADNIALNNNYLGIMLPYTPLHHLLMKELNFPIIATSGNLSDEPICKDEQEALDRLQNIADLFLTHNRPIVRPIDDSIAREINGRKMILRRARGYAPLPIRINLDTNNINKHKHLALGGHLKNTIALSIQDKIFISQHLGDLSNPETFNYFQQTITSLTNLYDLKPDKISCDLHPNYISNQYAKELNQNISQIQHHYAHILACLADNNILNQEVLGVAWDGTGYGLDGTIWGGEFLQLTPSESSQFTRIAYYELFPLVGGDQAVKEPRRSALGLLYKLFGNNIFQENHPYFYLLKNLFSQQELLIFSQMLTKKLNTPLTSSVGRLFDGVSALLNLYPKVTFEGQGAMALEYKINPKIQDFYDFEIVNLANTTNFNQFVIKWQKIIKEILEDLSKNQSLSIISSKFHNTLTEIIVKIAQEIKIKNIVLTGGCFQNKYLLEQAIIKLEKANFIPYWHHKIPPNDGGISVGQIISQLIINN